MLEEAREDLHALFATHEAIDPEFVPMSDILVEGVGEVVVGLEEGKHGGSVLRGETIVILVTNFFYYLNG